MCVCVCVCVCVHEPLDSIIACVPKICFIVTADKSNENINTPNMAIISVIISINDYRRYIHVLQAMSMYMYSIQYMYTSVHCTCTCVYIVTFSNLMLPICKMADRTVNILK